MGTRQMKRKFADLGLAEIGNAPAKKSRTEVPANAPAQPQPSQSQPSAPPSAPQSAKPQSARLVSSTPLLKPILRAEGGSSSASSKAASAAGVRAPSDKRVRVRLTDNTWTPVADPASAPSEKRTRYRLTNDAWADVSDIGRAQLADESRTPQQIMDKNDLPALRTRLQGAARGWCMADKADMLRHAAGTGNLAAFDVLLEFGALQALREEVPIAGRHSLLEEAAWGQNMALLDRLVACGMPIHRFARDELVMAIALSARKGGMEFLQRLCAAADAAGIRFQPADMRKIFEQTVQWEKNNQCVRVTSPVVMEWLMARYPGSFEPSVFAAALWESVDVGNWPAAEHLLGVCGVSANLISEGGMSLLMRAAISGRHGLHELLCFHGADPHAIDANGKSVLHHAVQGPGQRIVSDLVLHYRVDTGIRDSEGKTPADLALQLGRAHIVDIINSQPLNIDYLSRV